MMLVHYKWQQHCIAKTFLNFHSKAWSGAATSGFLGASHHQFRSMPINFIWYQCQSMPIIADQCWSIPINVDQCWSMPDQWLWSALIDIERNGEELIGIDGYWSKLIDIWINARILIGIDRYLSALGTDQGSPDIYYIIRSSFEF